MMVEVRLANTNDLIRRGDAMDAVRERVRQMGYENDPYWRSMVQAVADVKAIEAIPISEVKSEIKNVILEHLEDPEAGAMTPRERELLTINKEIMERLSDAKTD